MAAMLWRDETTNGIPRLKKFKEAHKSSTAVSNGITYEVSDDPSWIKVISPNGDSHIRCATFSDRNYKHFRGLTNGIIWNGEAYFACRGYLYALNLDRFEWRNVNTTYPILRGAPLVENSTANDLLLLTNEENGTILFTRFRPSLDDCKFVINYGFRIHPPSQCFEGIMPFRDLYIKQDFCMPTRQDGIFTIPHKWWEHMIEKGLRGCRIPEESKRVIIGIYNGTHPYPRSHLETQQLWKPSTIKSQPELEIINQLRERESKGVYSRECPVCFVPNPELRAVLIECGHLFCMACAMELAKKCNNVMCPFCRKNSKFQRIYEAENNNREETRYEEVDGITRDYPDDPEMDHSIHSPIYDLFNYFPFQSPISLHSITSLPFMYLFVCKFVFMLQGMK